jgi:hypothetical protein
VSVRNFSVVPFQLANYEVRPRHLLEVIDERVVHRCANNRHGLHGELLRAFW